MQRVPRCPFLLVVRVFVDQCAYSRNLSVWRFLSCGVYADAEGNCCKDDIELRLSNIYERRI
jgi:hypothetical protein